MEVTILLVNIISLNTISNGELSDPLCDSLTLVKLLTWLYVLHSKKTES